MEDESTFISLRIAWKINFTVLRPISDASLACLRCVGSEQRNNSKEKTNAHLVEMIYSNKVIWYHLFRLQTGFQWVFINDHILFLFFFEFALSIWNTSLYTVTSITILLFDPSSLCSINKNVAKIRFFMKILWRFRFFHENVFLIWKIIFFLWKKKHKKMTLPKTWDESNLPADCTESHYECVFSRGQRKKHLLDKLYFAYSFA